MKSTWLRTVVAAAAVLAMEVSIAEGEGVRIGRAASGRAHDALFGVAFDGDRGVAVGSYGSILDSADGGRNWTPVTPAPTELSLLGIAAGPSGDIAVGQKGLVLVRASAAAWKPVQSGSSERLFAIALNAEGRAVAGGAFGTVLLSDDAGQGWRSIAPDWSAYAEPGVQPHVYAVHVRADGVITLAGEFGLILRSDDAGASWTLLRRGDESLFGLELRSDGVGFAVGQSGTVLRSADGGATWVAIDARTKAHLIGVRSSSDGRVAVTAMREMMASRDDGRSWFRVRGEGVDEAWFDDVARPATGNRFVAVGHSGQIIRIGVGNRPAGGSNFQR